ncbi:MAG: hypothetical protein ACFFD4_21920 [Candidatus Odinarchaeota archaeon]
MRVAPGPVITDFETTMAHPEAEICPQSNFTELGCHTGTDLFREIRPTDSGSLEKAMEVETKE